MLEALLSFITVYSASSFAQQTSPEALDEPNELGTEKTPIKPIQNSNFYPDQDDDAGKDK